MIDAEAWPRREHFEHFRRVVPTFDVSSVPWTSFTGFNLNIDNGSAHLAPIFTLGRFVRRNSRVMLPLAIQAHHAAMDGFHIGRLVQELQDLLADPQWVV